MMMDVITLLNHSHSLILLKSAVLYLYPVRRSCINNGYKYGVGKGAGRALRMGLLPSTGVGWMEAELPMGQSWPKWQCPGRHETIDQSVALLPGTQHE